MSLETYRANRKRILKNLMAFRKTQIPNLVRKMQWDLVSIRQKHRYARRALSY